jgi:hypothetical protein
MGQREAELSTSHKKGGGSVLAREDTRERGTDLAKANNGALRVLGGVC